jgi:hypothetical protein
MNYSGSRCSVGPNVLGNLFIRVRRTQRTPWGDDESFPGICGDEPFREFDGVYHRLDVEISGQETRVDNRRVEWIRAFQRDIST